MAQPLQSDSWPNDSYEPVLRSAILFSKYFFSKSAKRIVNEQSTSFALASIKYHVDWVFKNAALATTKVHFETY